MKKIIVLLILICLMVTGCGESTVDEANSGIISVGEVKEIVDNYDDYSEVYIIDVREEYEYVAGHIEGAINIPLSTIEQITYEKDARIIVYCQSGRRSSQAADKLEKLGYSDVSDMGGISSWPYEVVEE